MNKHFIVPESHMTSCNQGSFSRKEVREPWKRLRMIIEKSKIKALYGVGKIINF